MHKLQLNKFSLADSMTFTVLLGDAVKLKPAQPNGLVAGSGNPTVESEIKAQLPLPARHCLDGVHPQGSLLAV